MHFKIRHGFLLVPAMCLVLAAPIHTHASDYRATAKVVCSTKTSVHIRKGPGLQYPVQTTIRRGEHVKKIGVSGSWTAVKSGGSVSYIKSCYLKKLYKLIYVAGDGVNLLSGPGTSYSSVAVLPKNTKLKCTGKSGGWMKVKYKKKTCTARQREICRDMRTAPVCCGTSFSPFPASTSERPQTDRSPV